MKKILTVLVFACVLALVALAGCSEAKHQVIKTNQDCKDCHSSTRETYEDALLSGVVAVKSTVEASTSADTIWVCKVHVASKDGSYYVPEKETEISVSGGKATLNLGEGVWALCTGKKESPTTTLVRVSPDGANEVKL